MPPSRDDFRLMREGAEAGDAVMQRELGQCCYHGDGVPQNYIEAARLFRLAADQGDADAQGSLAFCYVQGRGVPMDKAEGLRLLALGAEQGHAPSQLTLARVNRAAGGPVAAVPKQACEVSAGQKAAAAAAEAEGASSSALAEPGEVDDDEAV
jgi:TPR repeat protein